MTPPWQGGQHVSWTTLKTAIVVVSSPPWIFSTFLSERRHPAKAVGYRRITSQRHCWSSERTSTNRTCRCVRFRYLTKPYSTGYKTASSILNVVVLPPTTSTPKQAAFLQDILHIFRGLRRACWPKSGGDNQRFADLKGGSRVVTSGNYFPEVWTTNWMKRAKMNEH